MNRRPRSCCRLIAGWRSELKQQVVSFLRRRGKQEKAPNQMPRLKVHLEMCSHTGSHCSPFGAFHRITCVSHPSWFTRFTTIRTSKAG